MNILPVSFNYTTPHINRETTPLNNRINITQPKYTNTLATDTVTFAAKEKKAHVTRKISDDVEAQFAANQERLSRIATTYLDVLESVAIHLSDRGFSFDRAYCEQNPVKSPQSYTSKIIRSGTFKVPDTIRATLYCNNIYDLDNLNELLSEMQKRGYIVADTDMKISELIKRGYIPNTKEAADTGLYKTIPDLDIRLDDISEQITKLDPKYKYSIGKKQKSDYEDIQIRFVREFDKKKSPIQHELIILFGPNYSNAKHMESEKVYNNLRLFNELNMKFTDKTIGSHSHKANRYIELIEEMFRGKVSKKLFLNAKNIDLYDIKEEAPIKFTETDIDVFKNYFSGLNDRINSCYREAKLSAKASGLATKQLEAECRQDKVLLNKIRSGLADTINYYNLKAGFPGIDNDVPPYKTQN